jgi:hypothetical protein
VELDENALAPPLVAREERVTAASREAAVDGVAPMETCDRAAS